MYNNLIKVASANIKIKLLNVEENKNNILKFLRYAYENNIDIVNFPELTLTGVSAGQMIVSKEIVKRCKVALDEIVSYLKDKKMIVSIGTPISFSNFTLNSQAIIYNGEVYQYVLKNNLNSEQKNYFMEINKNGESMFSGDEAESLYNIFSIQVMNSNLKVAFIFEDDLYTKSSLYDLYIENNVNMLFVMGSSYDTALSASQRKDFLASLSKKDNISIIYSGASTGESSTNNVYTGQKHIFEAGELLESSTPYTDGMIFTDINIDEIRSHNLHVPKHENNIWPVVLELEHKEFRIDRKFNPHPFIPINQTKFAQKAKEILNIQAYALIRRLNQLPEKDIYLGLSGGLDSTQALIVASLAYSILKLDPKGIHAIIMPGLGTSSRTKGNAHKLAEAYGVSVEEISINESVLQHFTDIGHDKDDLSIVYENAQARERTQVLMDLSNKHGGMVLGTGNMSEIALGFSTYNGDHMSMYAVNAGLTKTLLREVVRYVKDMTTHEETKAVLADILDTPISPELLPPKDDVISQKTEDNIGPYELHDFYLYHLIRNRSSFEDTIYMASKAFDGKYSVEEIKKWMALFLRRFSTQQFKRSCTPDGPAIEDFSLNPRNGFIMASDIDILGLE
ncbi:MAG: NAD(+) synthase [Tissierellia bacterium]|nr:NAD(+) synthase [Tissierellia bacterium]